MTTVLKLFSWLCSVRSLVLLCHEMLCFHLSQCCYPFPHICTWLLKKNKNTPSAFLILQPQWSWETLSSLLIKNNNNYICTVQESCNEDVEANLVESGRNLLHLVDGDTCRVEPGTLSVLCMKTVVFLTTGLTRSTAGACVCEGSVCKHMYAW